MASRPAKKPKTARADNVFAQGLPRISKRLTLSDLKEEGKVRGFLPKELPKRKGELLSFLVDGSIHLKDTDAWKQVETLKAKIEQEKDHLLVLQSAKLKVEGIKAEAKKIAKEKTEAETKRKEVEEEKAEREKQWKVHAGLHAHSFPRVHGCELALSEDIFDRGGQCRTKTATCNKCRSGPVKFPFRCGWHHPVRILYSCERCNFDICEGCFQEENRTEEERERLRLAAVEELRARYDKKQFKASVMNPSSKNKTSSGNKKKGYTVWCSSGYGNDGWHSYEGEPDKEFDTTYKTKEEANARARYLFYWKNPWGITPEELVRDGCDEADETEDENGLHKFVIAPPDSEVWTVGVVPDAGFEYLDNATSRRHGYDRY